MLSIAVAAIGKTDLPIAKTYVRIINGGFYEGNFCKWKDVSHSVLFLRNHCLKGINMF